MYHVTHNFETHPITHAPVVLELKITTSTKVTAVIYLKLCQVNACVKSHFPYDYKLAMYTSRAKITSDIPITQIRN